MKLNGRTIPTPRQNIAIEYVELSRSERTVTGRLVKEKIGIKKRFSIPYAGLKPDDAAFFANIYETGKPVEFEYESFKGIKTVSVYVVGFSGEIYSYKPQYTGNVTVLLEER
jgi:hypothetical protein